MKKIKNDRQGFTLLELLIVVVIIGILAAIALPQYQMAVGKAQLSTLKNLTRSLAESHQRYYLTYDQSTTNLNKLDIEKQNDISCSLVANSKMKCCKEIFNTDICYYVSETGKPLHCTAFTIDTTDKPNRLCQQETGKSADQGSCNSGIYCTYNY